MKNVDKFIFILKKDTEFNGLIPIYTKKGDEQNRFTYSATPPFYINIKLFLRKIYQFLDKCGYINNVRTKNFATL